MTITPEMTQNHPTTAAMKYSSQRLNIQYHASKPITKKSSSTINPHSIPTIPPAKLVITSTDTASHPQKYYTHIPTAAGTDFRRTTTTSQQEWALPLHLERQRRPHRQRDIEARIAAEAILYGTLGRWCDESSDASDSAAKVHQRKEILMRQRRQIVKTSSAALRAPFEVRAEEMGDMGDRMTPSTTRASLIRERPDWTERDECKRSESSSMKGLTGILPMLKRHMSMHHMRRRSCGSEDVTPEETELEEVGNMRIVRGDDSASIVTEHGRFHWTCVRFAHR